MKNLISMSEFVLWIRGMTTSELCAEIPTCFKMPVFNGNKDDMVKDMLAIDAIKWRITGEYAKFLNKPIKPSMFTEMSEDESYALLDPKLSKMGNENAKRFKIASKKVLFLGGYIGRTGENSKDDFYYIESKVGDNSYRWFIKDYFKKDYTPTDNQLKTVEDLTKFNLELTESAIKQILR